MRLLIVRGLVSQGRTRTYLNANIQSGIELITIRTTASKTTGSVETISGTTTRIVQTLVFVHALIVVRMQRIAVRTSAPVSTQQILAT